MDPNEPPATCDFRTVTIVYNSLAAKLVNVNEI